MKIIRNIIIVFISLIVPLHAAGEPLVVGIQSFTPPFVMQGAKNEIYGFDVDMMNSLCKILDRSCQFRIMKFEELIPAVENNTIDAAVSSITITSKRAKIVSFSSPYLMSYSRFLATHSTESKPFSIESLTSKTVGVESGTIFSDQINDMKIKNVTIKEYPRIEEQLEALNSGKVDYILVDNPTALYWEANSSGAFSVVGKPYMYGYGLGIVMNINNKELVQNINKAILQYQDSDDFKTNYNRYLYQF